MRGWVLGAVTVAGLVLAAGLVMGRGAHRTDMHALRASGVSSPVLPRATSQAAQPRPSGALRIRGVVTDDHGPVAGVRVSATQPEPERTLSELPCPQDVLARQDRPPSRNPGLPQCMEETVTQVVEWVRAREGEAPVHAETTTGADGTFVLDNLPEGAFALWAVGSRGALLRTGVPVGTDGVELRLEQGLTLEGTVTSEDGQTPVPGALVTALHRGHTRFFDARTGSDGRFRLGPLPGEDYGLVILADGWLPGFFHFFRFLTHPVRLSRPRRLTGRVLAPGGAPAAHVEVRVEATLPSKERWVQVTPTDDAGRFTFPALPPGKQTVSASRDGLHAFALLELGDAPPPEVVLTLGDALLARGTVRDTDGHPLAGVELSTAAPGNTRSDLHTVTGADGRYSLGPLVPGSHVFTVSAPGYLDLLSAKRRVDADSGPVDFTLARAVSVEGTVQDARGHPLAGIPIQLMSRGSDGVLDFRCITETDASGHFVLDAPEPGEGVLQLDEKDFLPAEPAVHVPSRDVQVVLRRGASVAGTVLDPGGLPLGGAAVRLWTEEDTRWAVVRSGTANDVGRFSLGGVKAGRYVLEARIPSPGLERLASRPVTLKEDDTTEVSLRFEEGRTLSGVVVDAEGQPVPEAEVRARLASESLLPWRRDDVFGERSPKGERSGPDGRFTLRHLAAGNHLLSVDKHGYHFEAERSRGGEARGSSLHVDAKATDVRLVVAREGRIRGRLVGPDGAPLTAFDVNGKDVMNPGGTFEHPFSASGVEELQFSAPGLAPRVQEVEVREGTDVDLGTVRLEAGRRVRGRVLDAETSAPIENARATLYRAPPASDGSSLPIGEPQDTDEDGAFTFLAVEHQPLTLEVTASRYLPRHMTLAPDAEEVTVRLDAGARVEITVRDAEGRPLESLVSFTGLNGWLGVPTQQGTALVRGLSPGDYTVEVDPRTEPPHPVFLPQRVRIPDHGRLVVPFTPRSGGATVVLHAEPPASRLLLVPGDVPAPADWAAYPTVAGRAHPSDGTSQSAREVTFQSVPPGRYTVFAFVGRPNSRIHREVLEVPASGTVTRDVRPVWRPFDPDPE